MSVEGKIAIKAVWAQRSTTRVKYIQRFCSPCAAVAMTYSGGSAKSGHQPSGTKNAELALMFYILESSQTTTWFMSSWCFKIVFHLSDFLLA